MSQLTAADGHVLHVHRVEPLGAPLGGVIVVQEIFGVNAHIRAVCARFAAAGYVAVAPAFFDRVEVGVELGYDGPGFGRGRELVGKLAAEGVLADLAAARESLGVLRVGVVGYCWGGAVVWRAAARARALGLDAAVSYYGSRIPQFLEELPEIPLMMHVGRRDTSFPMEAVDRVAERAPDVEIHRYDAGHGFDCDHRADFDSTASAWAMTRTLGFLASRLG